MISFQILGLQEQMIKEGKLKSQADFDHFWMEMKKPEIFHSYFPGMLILSRYIGFDHFDFLICGYFSEYLQFSELFLKITESVDCLCIQAYELMTIILKKCFNFVF